MAKLCGEMFVPSLRTCETPQNLPPTVTLQSPLQISPRFWQKLSAQFERGSEKAESRILTARLRHREVCETGRSGSHRTDRERSPVPHQSREPGSKEKLQAPWVSGHALTTFLGCLSARDGHHLQVPITRRRRAPKCQARPMY